MKVTEGIKWIGVCTDKFEESVCFFKNVMGLEITQEGVPKIDTQFSKYCVFKSESDVMFEVFQPSDEIRGRYTGPVVSFTVDNLKNSYEEMKNRVEFITSEITDGATWRWRYFRAVDDNIYQIQQRFEEKV